MRKSGIILKKSGVIFESTSFLQKLTRAFAYGLLVASIAGVFFNLQPVISSELNFRFTQFSGQNQRPKNLSDFGNLLLAQANQDEEKIYSQQLAKGFGLTDTDFSIYIPKIEARAEIIGNVDSGNKEEFQEALKRGVAHAAGSRFPGMDGGTYLFAHSTDAPFNIARYNAVFYLLRELEKNDEIYVFFLDKIYKYKVSEKYIVPADDVSWLTNAKTGPSRLILQTCWPPGTTWKRLIIVAYPVKT